MAFCLFVQFGSAWRFALFVQVGAACCFVYLYSVVRHVALLICTVWFCAAS